MPRLKDTLSRLRRKRGIPDGVWTKCPSCEEIVYSKELEAKLKVCPKCNYHFRLTWQERLEQLVEPDSFQQIDTELLPTDPLNFVDLKNYSDRLKEAQEKTGLQEAIVTGIGNIGPHRVVIGIMDFSFLGGSMGSVVGEKITRALELAMREKLPVVMVCASGGARMQEGILSLMQMAKTSAAVGKLHEAGLPYITVLTDPTTGGVSASFAYLGDIIIAEPKALIGFAGPRVIEKTIGQKLPEGFQRAEFVYKHGLLDIVVKRKDLKDTLIKILNLLTK
ncbi:MAG: acetyl-CoA carboxylase carboxyltransferase subunit beta [Caldiserica bacterium]|nr:acetyl-CoA carboxylase carboxyltransferase subunit beta [Caldisericota bacterium]